MQDAAKDHNHDFVSSRDVDGTAVYSLKHEHVGTIDHLMIDKETGKVAYAIMGFGGFLGLGEEEYAIPWGSLNYDRSAGGFVTDITPDQLKAAPPRPENWYRDRTYQTRLYDHYGVPYFWL
ncbi:MAG: PRC-barrel domain-containing protein [Paracoccaceae bacterium]